MVNRLHAVYVQQDRFYTGQKVFLSKVCVCAEGLVLWKGACSQLYFFLLNMAKRSMNLESDMRFHHTE